MGFSNIINGISQGLDMWESKLAELPEGKTLIKLNKTFVEKIK